VTSPAPQPHEPLAWVDGQLIPRSQPAVPVDDAGLKFGAAAFETMLARNGRIFRWPAHLQRLNTGLALLRVTPPPTDLLERAITEALEANALPDASDASVRLSVSPGDTPAPDLRTARAPRIIVTVAPAATTTRGRIAVAATRIDADRPWAHAKLAQFLPYLLAREEARELGADDALLLDHDGHAVELATANLFLVLRDGATDRLLTPPLACGPIPGITRAAIIEVARTLEVPIEEAPVTLDHLAIAPAAFGTNSLAGIASLESLTATTPTPLNITYDTAHPLLARIATAYEALVTAECGPR